MAPTSKSESTTNSTASRAKSANTGGQHQYSAHYTGSSATDDSSKPRRPQDMSALDRLKLIQSNFKQNWVGIQCESGGRPGTSNFVNKNRAITVIETAVAEDDRQKLLLKIFSKLKEIDEDRLNQGTSRNSQNSQSSFYN